MTPTERTLARLPAHLRRYVVGQDYASYTPRDQAVWRHILRRLSRHLSDKAHPVYLEGLQATGIGVERIPSLDEMNERLARLNWAAVGVRGFIPPAVFTELQSMRVLAIAADIRTHEHIPYTPAPDIVHESAGHAPILAHARYAEYLQRSGVVGFKSIATVEDQAVFEAIRHLSVVKEDPTSTPAAVEHAQARLEAASQSRRYVSESTQASRLYWWTAEYGLVGSLEQPRLYGAGLLSSIGEAEHCFTPAVKRVPLSLECVRTDYDITRMQPQLFVARDFEHLFEVLEAFEATLSWKRGGDYGLQEAQRARTVNHLVLSDGREITGRVVELLPGTRPVAEGLSTALVSLAGPLMLSQNGKSLGKPWQSLTLVAFGEGKLPEQGPFQLELASGLRLEGFAGGEGEVLRLRGSLGGRPLELPSVARLFLGTGLPSVAGGPADPGAWDRWFGEMDSFTEGEGEVQARARKADALHPALATLYREVRAMRESHQVLPGRLEQISRAAASFPDDWLLKAEVEELRVLSPQEECVA
ncbi:aromatic amino acid hydroxylase [Stigmatella aurantiaca]|uniref:Aromatic amino acid hydroxylase, biopterin-dependent n=1 Tax=Stigmatella aurantiaca (strain DW4/3-1) TaxID=378806 RepID=Q08RX0_STIAD|nr:aromatic amino acid hydroxylase [Stigmatella aurantiaca]ADO69104.1 Aromatic amino acid hydroxylase, biopterin-dependent [Stigmatella aurantiaca DW4/3-1]EAU63228.1 PAH [Stigmatella aurantiaca DW4/3-1]